MWSAFALRFRQLLLEIKIFPHFSIIDSEKRIYQSHLLQKLTLIMFQELDPIKLTQLCLFDSYTFAASRLLSSNFANMLIWPQIDQRGQETMVSRSECYLDVNFSLRNSICRCPNFLISGLFEENCETLQAFSLSEPVRVRDCGQND